PPHHPALHSFPTRRSSDLMKPPFPAVKGLFQQATVVNNVETLMNVPDIVDKGAEWFAGLGTAKSGGTRIVCVSGHVARPGVYELDRKSTRLNSSHSQISYA